MAPFLNSRRPLAVSLDNSMNAGITILFLLCLEFARQFRNRMASPPVGNSFDAPDTRLASLADVAEIRIKLMETAIAIAAENYRENARVTGVLDDKAQKLAQTAGVFLGAAFAFLKPILGAVATPFDWLDLLLIRSLIGLLLFTILVTLIANLRRRIPAPVRAQTIHELASDLIDLPDDELSPTRRLNHARQISEMWIVILERQEKVNRIKGTIVLIAQISLTLTLALAAFLLFHELRGGKIG
jgi:hypothetical protein